MTDRKPGNRGSDKKGDNKGLTPPPEDDALWQEATRDVEPLPEKPPEAGTRDSLQEIRRIRKKLREKGLEAPPPEHRPGRQGRTAATSTDLDRRTDDRLRRGLMEIEARLDLHGMTQDAALSALERFILQGRQRGLRCVLVITGKGGRRMPDKNDTPWYEPQPGILRERVQEWLRTGTMADLVLRLYPAKPQHGGDGAFYVLLRRDRQG